MGIIISVLSLGVHIVVLTVLPDEVLDLALSVFQLFKQILRKSKILLLVV